MKKPEEMLSSVARPQEGRSKMQVSKTPLQLSKYTVEQLLTLHGMGTSSIPKLLKVLKSQGLSFKRK